jgi:hypothetical protein
MDRPLVSSPPTSQPQSSSDFAFVGRLLLIISVAVTSIGAKRKVFLKSYVNCPDRVPNGVKNIAITASEFDPRILLVCRRIYFN